MLLLVGLGNPGPSYAGNRHNIGFIALDAIARRHGFGPWRRRFQGEVAEGQLAGEKVLALKPLTYMNESGRAVGEASRFYKIEPQDVIVLHDELDLAPGKVKVKAGGGAAGHNGLRSITSHIGPYFRRVRLGIGHPGHKDRVLGWVLSDFAKADAEWLERLTDAVAADAPLLAENSEKADGSFMSRVNQAVFPPKPRKPKPAAAAPAARAPGPAPGPAPTTAAAPPAAEEPESLIARALRQAREKLQHKD
ncbi:peptidyl-tRNA hydrolase [Tistlia consotensis]|uniref:Peptidyl-tRNA hydrolase n=1 Tax=Tistlia consotensis USBA 355 TaxID=560819 RepID=A0A1Y6C6A7_9PROT|nr:aminoacyl-tRNA hydrolase [Tistlia consotensis]SMF46374.1 peptidyl-tRNA hydrolase [Tistlia consotensis USBA 355]SNR78517.1 peptidyl-tRNA hydrolase [Tistlia consotensis]